MRKFLLFVGPLIVAGSAANASTLTFEADYLPLSEKACFTICFTLPGPYSPFAKTFTLDSSQLAVDGTYNVVASLSPNPLITVTPPTTESHSLSANAVVSLGIVTDLLLTYSQSITNTNFLGTTFSDQSFAGAAGKWSDSGSASNTFSHSSNSNSDSGTYTIHQQVVTPEPGSLVLLLGGLLTIVSVRPRRKQ